MLPKLRCFFFSRRISISAEYKSKERVAAPEAKLPLPLVWVVMVVRPVPVPMPEVVVPLPLNERSTEEAVEFLQTGFKGLRSRGEVFRKDFT